MTLDILKERGTPLDRQQFDWRARPEDGVGSSRIGTYVAGHVLDGSTLAH